MIPCVANHVIRLTPASLTKGTTMSISVTYTKLYPTSRTLALPPRAISFARTELRNTFTVTATSTSIVSTGGSLLVVPPEVVVSSQMLQIHGIIFIISGK
eukprot:PhF_6_TR40438/c0_g1_i5/m.60337